jgi:hypothetical protein
MKIRKKQEKEHVMSERNERKEGKKERWRRWKSLSWIIIPRPENGKFLEAI